MKKGSNLLLVMIGIYIVIAVVVLLMFMPKSTGDQPKEPESVKAGQEARTIGDASKDAPVDNTWVYSDGTITDEDLADQGLPIPTVAPEDGEEGAPTSTETPEDGEEAAATPTEAPGAEEAEPTEAAEDTVQGNGPFYSFKVRKIKSSLMVRKEPNTSAEVLGRMKTGREGYVLEKGEEWSRIVTKDGKLAGYSFNRYMEFEEIDKSELPEEYR